MTTRGGVNMLVFNCGSSSLTFKVFAARSQADLRTVVSGKAHRVGVKGTQPSFLELRSGEKSERVETPLRTHAQAASLAIEKLAGWGVRIDCVGHRWGHGGNLFQTAWVDKDLMAKLRLLMPMMPIHHPAMYGVISPTSTWSGRPRNWRASRWAAPASWHATWAPAARAPSRSRTGDPSTPPWATRACRGSS